MKKIICLLLLIISFIVLSFINSRNEKVLFLGSSTKIKFNNKIEIINDNYDFNSKKAKIYYEGSFIDGYIYSEKSKEGSNYLYSFVDETKNILISTDGLIAYTGNIKIDVAKHSEYNILSSNERESIKKFLEDNDITSNITNSRCVEYDIDGDSKNEIIYSITVVSPNDFYTIVLLKDDDEIKLVSMENGNIEHPDIKKIRFSRLIDIDEDKKYEIILKLSSGDDSLTKYKVFKYDGNDISEIK